MNAMNWEQFHKVLINDKHVIDLNNELSKLISYSPIIGLKLVNEVYLPIYPDEYEQAINNVKKEILLRIEYLKDAYLK